MSSWAKHPHTLRRFWRNKQSSRKPKDLRFVFPNFDNRKTIPGDRRPPVRVQPLVTLRLPALLALALLANSASPQRDPEGVDSAPANGHTLCALDIHVTGFRNNTGTAGTLVFASPAGWPDKIAKTIAHDGFPIANRQAQLAFQLPAGRYAVVVIHDENSNMKLDRNFFGVPREGFGFSHNPRISFSAPSFQSAVVPVACPKAQFEIKLIYK